ncbi:MAG: signal peptidase I [Pirellulales bacterium]
MAKAATPTTSPISNAQYIRETVESIIVAFILAFLFRAFVAEAFVIPTGSMAPTLMGAHKDITCFESGERYQVGASNEFDKDTGEKIQRYVVGSTSSLSRAVNPIDFEDRNHETFSGDRILVSKFDYVLSSPKRWDVIVFKYPANARQNFIKRLVGLPNEELMIHEGDIFVRRSEAEPWTIARKPPHKLLAMRQPVSDTNHLSKSLISLGFPSLWQNWSSDNLPGWTVEQNAQGWTAQLQSSNSPSWLRYYHKTLSEKEWLGVERDKQIPLTAPQDSSLVTDYLAYNSYNELHQAVQMDVKSLVENLRRSDNGMHWVGDLFAEFNIEIQSDSGQLMLQAYEFGIEFRMTIEVKTGEAKLEAFDAIKPDRPLIQDIFSGQPDVIAATQIRGKGSYNLAMANVDDQILVWINGSLVKFNQPAEYTKRSSPSDCSSALLVR